MLDPTENENQRKKVLPILFKPATTPPSSQTPHPTFPKKVGAQPALVKPAIRLT